MESSASWGATCTWAAVLASTLIHVACSNDDADDPAVDAGADGALPDGNQPADGSTADGEAGESGGGDAAPSVVLSGVVRRSADLASGGDGIGTVCFSIIESCPMPDDLAVTPIVGGFSMPDVDVSAQNASVPFELVIDAADLPDGTYALFGWLRESGGGCDGAPTSGDLVSAMLLGGASCPEVVVSGPGEVPDLELYLNVAVP